MTPDIAPLSLTAGHREQLAASALTDEIIRDRGYVSALGPVPIKEREPRFGKTQVPAKTGGLLFPVYRLGNPEPYAWVLRPDKPRSSSSNGKPVKYEWPKDVAAIMDVLPRYQEALRDTSKPVWFTEGAKKADALAAAFGDQIVPVNLNGVYGWRTRTDALHKATATLSDLEEVPWQGRTVVLAFDSDVKFNRNVRDALARFGRVLASKGAEVLMLALPQEKGGEKLGVDDYLAQGHYAADLKAHLQTLTDAASVGREKFGRHPETGEDLYFPAGWVNAHDCIALEDKNGVEVAYPGRLAVYSVGVDATTEAEVLEVRFEAGEKVVSVVAPRAELATRKGVITHLAARGAHVHEGNGLRVVRFLTEFAAENQSALPRRVFSDRLGNLRSGALVTPTATIGGEAKYTGRYAAPPAQDAEAFAQAVREIAGWKGAWPLWVALSASLASPLMGRMDVRRNPVLYLEGDSNTGKTSAAYFALGAWVQPGRHPFVMQGVRTTAAGIAQSMEELGGLPALLDEAHTVPHADRLEGAVYAFANGQTYTRGGRDGQARGGTPLSGSLLLAGEAVAEFKYAGSRNRVLYLDADTAPPLGTEATRSSLVGRQRAEILEAAWRAGAGQLGPKVIAEILDDWEGFVETVKALRAAPEFAALADWGEATAVMYATLGVLLGLLDIEIPSDVAALPRHMATALSVARTENPAHLEAWETLVTMIVQAEQESQEDSGGRLVLRGEVIGWEDDSCWYILTDGETYGRRVGKSAAQLHGRRWLEQGLIAPGTGSQAGKSTVSKWMSERGAAVRVLQVIKSGFKGDPEN